MPIKKECKTISELSKEYKKKSPEERKKLLDKCKIIKKESGISNPKCSSWNAFISENKGQLCSLKLPTQKISRIKKVAPENVIGDIDPQLATSAFYHTSWTPEDRGKYYRKHYVENVMSLYDSIYPKIPDERKEEFIEDFNSFRARYRTLNQNYLASHGRLASAAVVGPARFPTRMMNKREGYTRTHRLKMTDFYDKVQRKWRSKYFGKGVIRSGIATARTELEKKLEKLEAAQELMKSANKVIKKGVNVKKKLVSLGLTELNAQKLLIPNYLGKTGFEPYQLSNNSANIRRIRKRIEQEKERTVQYAAGDKEYTIKKVKVLENVGANRIQLSFVGKPSIEIRKKLKSKGFHWSPREEVWQRQLTNAAIYAAKTLLEGL